MLLNRTIIFKEEQKMKKIINKIKEWFKEKKELIGITLSAMFGGFCVGSAAILIVTCIYGMITKQKLRWSK